MAHLPNKKKVDVIYTLYILDHIYGQALIKLDVSSDLCTRLS